MGTNEKDKNICKQSEARCRGSALFAPPVRALHSDILSSTCWLHARTGRRPIRSGHAQTKPTAPAKPPRRLSGGFFGYFLSQIQKVISPDTVRIDNPQRIPTWSASKNQWLKPRMNTNKGWPQRHRGHGKRMRKIKGFYVFTPLPRWEGPGEGDGYQALPESLTPVNPNQPSIQRFLFPQYSVDTIRQCGKIGIQRTYDNTHVIWIFPQGKFSLVYRRAMVRLTRYPRFACQFLFYGSGSKPRH